MNVYVYTAVVTHYITPSTPANCHLFREHILIIFSDMSSDLILRSLLLLHFVRNRLNFQILLSLHTVQRVFCGNPVQHSVLTLCESCLKALALRVLAVKTHVILVQDKVGPVEGLHGSMQGCGIQELLSLMSGISLRVIVVSEAVLVRLARTVTLVSPVIVVHCVSVGVA